MLTYALVFLAAAAPGFEVLVAVPLGIIRGMPPAVSAAVGFAGNAATVLLVVAVFARLQMWRDKKRLENGGTAAKRTARAESIWKRYGIVGLALLGPVLIGSHLAAFLALTLGASKQQTSSWLLISLAAWSIVFALLTVLGVDVFHWLRA